MAGEDTRRGKVWLVTGANKGIGLEVVKQLSQLTVPGDSLILTSRDSDRGHAAVNKMAALGLRPPDYHQLDITSDSSVAELATYIQGKGGLDVLVNNAGIAFSHSSTVPVSEQAEATLATNYWGTLRVCQALFPLLRRGARVVNVSSNCGHLSKINGDEPGAGELRRELSSPELTLDRLGELMSSFVDAAKRGDHVAEGWPNSSYKVSKVGVSALSILQQRLIDAERPGQDIVINHAHPGYVATDMSNYKGCWSVEQGARSIVYAATLPPGTVIKGKFIWEDSTVTSWVEAEVNLFYA